MKMFRVIVIALCVSVMSVSAEAQITFGKAENINDGWKFRLDSLADYSSVKVNDKKWRNLDLPHDWSVEGEASPDLASCTGYLPGGIGWYRKTLYMPGEEAIRKQTLYFEGVYNNSEVWVNGIYVGKRPSGYVSFAYDISRYLRYGADNVIAVKVDHSKSADSRWYTGSGIYRDVYLVSSEYIHIDNWGISVTSRDISKRSATLDIATDMRNETSDSAELVIEHSIYKKDGSGIIASTKNRVTVPAGDCPYHDIQSVQISYPELWSVDSPSLYRVETVVYGDDNECVDGTVTVTGIRETRFDPDHGFFLNGENMKMKGVCLHHDAGALGAVVPEPVWRRRLLSLKAIGCNAIRMSHNPQAEVLYDLCDELGFLVMDEAFDEWEFPKRKWIEGWNVGNNPGYQGSSEYFEEWGREISPIWSGVTGTILQLSCGA